MRKTKFAKGELYHIFNRGVDKRKVFGSVSDYFRFKDYMLLFNDIQDGLMIRWRDYSHYHAGASIEQFLRLNLKKRRPLVKFIAYCLNPNHYHFILEELAEKGVETFMHRLGTGYSMYFNKRYKRSGSLFQGPFKSVHIKSNNQLLYLSVYVNCNSEIHKISSARTYQWCSYPDYLKLRNEKICEKKIISDQFKTIAGYRDFSRENLLYMIDKKEWEKYLLD